MENVKHVDCHQLIPRFAAWRLHDPERLDQLVRSVDQHGQLTPVVVVPVSATSADSPHWVLIDGYRRLAALHQIGEEQAVTGLVLAEHHALAAVECEKEGVPAAERAGFFDGR